ncbi:MAG: dienelactone hydrolase family protein [Saprospiraceae bacterium]|nr:dienelactone hydrolase family protein [Saprospiraceae bacterium]
MQKILYNKMMHTKQVIIKGKLLSDASKALILLHGRGGSADDILSLANYLQVNDFTLLAPQATNNTWYPYSFMMPQEANEPWLSSALEVVNNIFDDIIKAGIAPENIYLAGFSQGACLTLEFAARNAQKLGGVIAFSGGLIGREINSNNYQKDFQQTPIFIGCSDVDPHIPLKRVHESKAILQEMNAAVTAKIYPGMGHSVNEDEIKFVNDNILSK